ncbi:hypothetical protein D3C85_1220480 [compost metagenome]
MIPVTVRSVVAAIALAVARDISTARDKTEFFTTVFLLNVGVGYCEVSRFASAVDRSLANGREKFRAFGGIFYAVGEGPLRVCVL